MADLLAPVANRHVVEQALYLQGYGDAIRAMTGVFREAIRTLPRDTDPVLLLLIDDFYDRTDAVVSGLSDAAQRAGR